MAQAIAIERVDHIGIRMRDLDRALRFYEVLGFELVRRAEGDDVGIVCNKQIGLNLVFNANAGDPGANILMDVPEKFPGYTQIALRVASIPATIARSTQMVSRSRRARSASARPNTSRFLFAIPIAT